MQKNSHNPYVSSVKYDGPDRFPPAGGARSARDAAASRLPAAGGDEAKGESEGTRRGHGGGRETGGRVEDARGRTVCGSCHRAATLALRPTVSRRRPDLRAASARFPRKDTAGTSRHKKMAAGRSRFVRKRNVIKCLEFRAEFVVGEEARPAPSCVVYIESV